MGIPCTMVSTVVNMPRDCPATCNLCPPASPPSAGVGVIVRGTLGRCAAAAAAPLTCADTPHPQGKDGGCCDVLRPHVTLPHSCRNHPAQDCALLALSA
jgi:hypothetical protein